MSFLPQLTMVHFFRSYFCGCLLFVCATFSPESSAAKAPNVLVIIADRFGTDVLAEYVIARMKSAVAAGEPFYIHHNMLLPHWPIITTPNDKAAGREGSLESMVAYTDKIVGQLMDAVEVAGVADNTWLLFLGDKGTDSKLPRHTADGEVTGGKHHLVDAGIHIPVIIRGPGLEGSGLVGQGVAIDDLVDIADFFPTICELVGVEVPKSGELDGRSFARRLTGQTEETHRDYVTAAFARDDCVFDGEWRLHRLNDVLYDCRELPMEKVVTDDAAVPGAAEARVRLAQKLESIRRKK